MKKNSKYYVRLKFVNYDGSSFILMKDELGKKLIEC